jgi:hypothetical protein
MTVSLTSETAERRGFRDRCSHPDAIVASEEEAGPESSSEAGLGVELLVGGADTGIVT